MKILELKECTDTQFVELKGLMAELTESVVLTPEAVEDVVVSSAYRGQHLGRQLVEHVIEQARALAPIELMLTSNPTRVAANKLYQSLGFQRKETNCYRMSLG